MGLLLVRCLGGCYVGAAMHIHHSPLVRLLFSQWLAHGDGLAGAIKQGGFSISYWNSCRVHYTLVKGVYWAWTALGGGVGANACRYPGRLGTYMYPGTTG